MEVGQGETSAFSEAVVFLEYFRDLPDPRQQAKVICPLDEVLLLSLLAVLAGAEIFTDIARFGEKEASGIRRSAKPRPSTVTTGALKHARQRLSMT